MMNKSKEIDVFETRPLVSIYIPTHNRMVKLKRALNSVFTQSYQNFEILVCDDASTDGTQSMMMKIVREDSRVRYFKNLVSEGACCARNLGIFAARGEFITGLDDDDEFMPKRLETLLKNWRDEYSFICSNFIDRYPNRRDEIYYKKHIKIINIEKLLHINEASNQVFTKTTRLREINGFDPTIRKLQDWDTWIRLCNAYGSFIRIKLPLYILNHDHASSESRVSNNMPLYLAMEDLYERNKNLYNQRASKKFKFSIKRLKNEYLFMDMIDEMLEFVSIKPIYYYIKQYIKLISSRNSQI
ncbi:MAG TPA: glycosyl transferase family 2 [Cellvibrio sp.]|nr:glycosyl transferase family 2 [Cellvibrio sp.]